MKQIVGFVFVLLITISLFSCSHTKTVKDGRDFSNDTVMLQRTICYGQCPAYKIAVLGSGKVEFEGFKFSKTQGKVSVDIPLDSAKTLISEIEQSDFFSWKDEYNNQDVTDLASTFVTVVLSGNKKIINHYNGDKSAPSGLVKIEKHIDAITNSEQWIR
ncbi:MAG: hypothetical protein HYZ54_14500 [Ignavibacteriae bacterium]|nr:hypothetical protein [Ignavibacteriota bacterium]